MTLYRVTPERFESVPRTTFAAASLLERKDLQRLLRRDISPFGDDLMVIAEEYGDWEDSNRRIDLLCLSKDADLVVVEIKRTEDGGHMELQAIRYAAMVSGMTLDQVVQAYIRTSRLEADAARSAVLDFLQPDSDVEPRLSGNVRIILVSADFSTELTTAVLWLNKRNLSITCIRLRPYRSGNDILVDATQIIPLPEAADYEVKMRAQEEEQRKLLSARQELLRRFWAQLIERSKARTPLLSGRSTTTDHWLSTGIGRGGFTLTVTFKQHEAQVECYIKLASGKEKTLDVFQRLLLQKDEIEAKFGGALEWEDLEDRQGCRVCTRFPGGWRSVETEWTEIQDKAVDALIRLEGALKKPVSELSV